MKPGIVGEGRLQLWGAEVDPDELAGLAHRIGRRLHPLLEGALRRLGRRLLDRAIDAELPAVIEAANATVLDPAQHQRGAAMGAVLVQQTDLAATVAEGDEVLAQQADADG